MRVTRQFLINNANQIFQKIASMRDVLGTTGLDLLCPYVLIPVNTL